MADIQGIDGSVLLNAFRQGRADRQADDLSQINLATKQAALNRQQAVTSLLSGQGGTSGGVASNGAPMVSSGGLMGNALPQGGLNPALVGQVAAIDPESGQKMAATLKSLSDAQLAEAQHRATVMGAVAHYVMETGRGKTQQEREMVFEHALPMLQQAGYTQQQIDAARRDLSDHALTMYQNSAMKTDQMLDAELKTREFMAGKTTPIPAEGSLAVTKPVIGNDGSVSTQTQMAVLPNPGGVAPGAKAPTSSSSIPPTAIDHLRKNPQLRALFDQKYGAGSADSVLGGTSGNAGGSFPR